MALGGFAPLPLRLGGSATEGWSPAQHARAAADLVAIKRTVPLLKMTFTTLNPGAATIHALHSVHGVGSAFFPDQIVTIGVGDVIFGWSARRWFDDYEISHPFIFRHGRAGKHGATAGFCTFESQVWRFRIRLFNAAGAAVDGKASAWVY